MFHMEPWKLLIEVKTQCVSGKGWHWIQHLLFFPHTVLVIGFPWKSKLVYHISTKHFMKVRAPVYHAPNLFTFRISAVQTQAHIFLFSACGFNSSYRLTGVLPFSMDSVVKYQMSSSDIWLRTRLNCRLVTPARSTLFTDGFVRSCILSNSPAFIS